MLPVFVFTTAPPFLPQAPYSLYILYSILIILSSACMKLDLTKFTFTTAQRWCSSEFKVNVLKCAVHPYMMMMMMIVSVPEFAYKGLHISMKGDVSLLCFHCLQVVKKIKPSRVLANILKHLHSTACQRRKFPNSSSFIDALEENVFWAERWRPCSGVLVSQSRNRTTNLPLLLTVPHSRQKLFSRTTTEAAPFKYCLWNYLLITII